MIVKLIIEGSPTVIAQVLSLLPVEGGVTAVSVNEHIMPEITANAITDIQAGPLDLPSAQDDETGDTATNEQFDSSGLPWDDRIHSKPATFKKNGTWRTKRGVDEQLVKIVEAELRGNPASLVTLAPVANSISVSYIDPVMQPIAMPTLMPVETPVIPPIPVPVPIAPIATPPIPAPIEAPVAAPPPHVLDYSQFMQHLQTKMIMLDANGQPLFNQDYLIALTQEIAVAHNQPLNALTDIGQFPNMIPYAVSLLQRDGRW